MAWIDLYTVYGNLTMRFLGLLALIVAFHQIFFSGLSIVNFFVGLFWIGVFALVAWLFF